MIIEAALVGHLILWGGTALDLGTTIHNEKSKQAIEMNPFLGHSIPRQIIIVGGSTAFLDFVLTKKHVAPKLRWIVGAIHISAGIHNLRIK